MLLHRTNDVDKLAFITFIKFPHDLTQWQTFNSLCSYSLSLIGTTQKTTLLCKLHSIEVCSVINLRFMPTLFTSNSSMKRRPSSLLWCAQYTVYETHCKQLAATKNEWKYGEATNMHHYMEKLNVKQLSLNEKLLEAFD